jgi:hypothetical protein
MPRLALVAVVLLVVTSARAGAQEEAAARALRSDPSLKVRVQAAIVLGQRAQASAVPALCEALAQDRERVVRLAVVGSLARIGCARAREALEEASRSDADPEVRDAAARALAASAPRGEAMAFSIEEPGGKAGAPAARAALRDSLARHLRSRGFSVVERGGGYRLKPSLLRLDVESGAAGTVIAVTASLVAVDGQGRMAAMLEGGARLKATGTLPGGAIERYSARAVDAAARTLCDDLAARLR